MHSVRVLLLAFLLCVALVAVAAEPVNINKADAQTIATQLKGIGLKRAEAIVAYRQANGPFKSLEDLTKVKGVGASTVEQNREMIVLVDDD